MLDDGHELANSIAVLSGLINLLLLRAQTSSGLVERIGIIRLLKRTGSPRVSWIVHVRIAVGISIVTTAITHGTSAAAATTTTISARALTGILTLPRAQLT